MQATPEKCSRRIKIRRGKSEAEDCVTATSMAGRQIRSQFLMWLGKARVTACHPACMALKKRFSTSLAQFMQISLHVYVT